MIDFKSKQINLGQVSHEITDFEVWFQTPKGTSTTLHEALKVCEDLGLDPELSIRPVPVAVSCDPIDSIILAHEVMG